VEYRKNKNNMLGLLGKTRIPNPSFVYMPRQAQQTWTCKAVCVISRTDMVVMTKEAFFAAPHWVAALAEAMAEVVVVRGKAVAGEDHAPQSLSTHEILTGVLM